MTLYSVDPETREPRDPGQNRHTLYVHIHSTYNIKYIYSTCVSNRSTGMHYGTEQSRLNLLNMHVTFDP